MNNYMWVDPGPGWIVVNFLALDLTIFCLRGKFERSAAIAKNERHTCMYYCAREFKYRLLYRKNFIFRHYIEVKFEKESEGPRK